MIENLTAFKKGEKDCIKYNGNPLLSKNPYKKGTSEWRSHNKGWNNQIDKLKLK